MFVVWLMMGTVMLVAGAANVWDEENGPGILCFISAALFFLAAFLEGAL